MILADKIIEQRKKNGWSQEELAEMLDVSRQSVSKWEGAQSIPDLDRILKMADIFGVTTDYLLKDEIEDGEAIENNVEIGSLRKLSMEEANRYLDLRAKAGPQIGAGVVLTILAAASLSVMAMLGDIFQGAEELYLSIGLTVGGILVAIGIGLLIFSGRHSSDYKFLEEEPFDTAYGVDSMVKDRKNRFSSKYYIHNVTGIVLCVLAALPLIILSLAESELLLTIGLGTSLLIVSIGVFMVVNINVQWESMKKILQEGNYSPRVKQAEKRQEKVGAIYWPIVIAIYLAWSLIFNDWSRSWIIWPVAGLVFAAIAGIMSLGKK